MNEFPDCNHFRKIGPVAVVLSNNKSIGVWRWLFCERCHAIKQWMDGENPDKIEWKFPPVGIYLVDKVK